MFYLLVLLIALMLLLSLILSVINDLRKQRKVNFIVELLGWCLKFSRIVPVSLIVSMEFIKFFQGQVLE
jgi:vacuolar-type H+-ATPase subunit I/STV1